MGKKRRVNTVFKVCVKFVKQRYEKSSTKKNKVTEIEYGKQYRKYNQEKEKARAKRYKELNPEKVKESQKKYREANPEKVKERRKNWAMANKELVNHHSKNHRDTRREFLDIIKLEEGCQICGYNEHPRALQFDHINPAEKLFTIAGLLTCSMDKLLTELEKCRVLCANCHSIHSWQEQHWKSKDKENPRIEIAIKEIK